MGDLMKPVIGMAWYRPETFDRLRRMFKDGHKLHRTYDEWLAAAERGRKKNEDLGRVVFCIEIDPDDFPKWCRAEGLELDATARNRFASLMAYRAHLADREE